MLVQSRRLQDRLEGTLVNIVGRVYGYHELRPSPVCQFFSTILLTRWATPMPTDRVPKSLVMRPRPEVPWSYIAGGLKMVAYDVYYFIDKRIILLNSTADPYTQPVGDRAN